MGVCKESWIMDLSKRIETSKSPLWPTYSGRHLEEFHICQGGDPEMWVGFPLLFFVYLEWREAETGNTRSG